MEEEEEAAKKRTRGNASQAAGNFEGNRKIAWSEDIVFSVSLVCVTTNSMKIFIFERLKSVPKILSQKSRENAIVLSYVGVYSVHQLRSSYHTLRVERLNEKKNLEKRPSTKECKNICIG